jgi:adenylylsulfate kinase-like enzyme
MLRRSVLYADLGADHLDRAERTRLAARLARKLAELGFQVTLADRTVA